MLTEVSVWGCWGPSWDSQPSKARRWRPSAWRLEMELKVVKHEKSSSSGPMGHGKGRKANKGHNFWSIVRTYYSKANILSQIHSPILDFNEKILFQAPVKNCGNSPQSALDDHQNHSQNIINSVRGEGGKQENSPVPYQSFRNFCVPQEIPRTSAWPLPACPAASRERPSC